MKSLVIYFSHTGENYMRDGIRNIDKGNTKIVAEFINEITNADLFEVEPVISYPYSYKECCDKAKEELNLNIRPQIKNKIDNINDYDVIYIGGPVWWGHLPMPLFTAIEGLNFAGKIVKPFSTHEGSGLGSIMQDIEKLCKNADIKPGLAIRGSDANSSKDKLKGWCIL